MRSGARAAALSSQSEHSGASFPFAHAMRRASLLAHRAVGAARLAPSTAWVPTEGSGSPGEGRGLAPFSAAFSNPLASASASPPRPFSGPTFASSSSASFATTAGKAPPPREAQQTQKVDVETVNALFIEAREELEYASEDAGTTYAGESYDAAAAAVRAAGAAYAAFLAGLPDEAARGAAQRGMGMKFEQLKAELEAVDLGH